MNDKYKKLGVAGTKLASGVVCAAWGGWFTYFSFYFGKVDIRNALLFGAAPLTAGVILFRQGGAELMEVLR